MSSNTTYYVDINSEYRDLEKFPNPADFAISFKTNSQTGYYPQGLPISPSGYFQQASIDPDFVDADLEFYRCSSITYKRIDNIIFVSGVSIGANPSIRYKNQIIFNIQPIGNIPAGNIQYNQFLIRIDVVQEEIPYKVAWNVYTNPKTIYSKQTASVRYTITNDNNIYLFLIYENPFDLNIQYADNQISTLISNIQPPYGDDSPSYPELQYTFLLDFDGNLGLYNGHNWGYHTCGSKTNSIFNIIADPVVDNGKNLYCSLDFNCSSLSFGDGGLKFVDYDYILYPRNFYTYTGIDNNPLLFIHSFYITDDELNPVNLALTTGSFWISTNSYTGTTFLNQQNLNTPSNISSIGWGDFVETNNNVYSVKNYFTEYTGPSNSPATGGLINPDLPIQYYIYDKTGIQFNYVTQTSPGSYNGYMYPHSISYGNNIYTFGRASFTGCDTSSQLYVYKFNTSTNSVSKVATIGFTGANFTNSRIFAVAELNYIYIMCSDYDTFNPNNDNVVNGYVVRFDPATNNIIQYSEYDVLAASIIHQSLLIKGSEKYLVSSYSSNPDIDFYNITNYSSVVDQYAVPSVVNSKPIVTKYNNSYYMIAIEPVSIIYSVYNINDLNNISQQLKFSAGDNYVHIDNNGYIYGWSDYVFDNGYYYSLSYTVYPFWYGTLFSKYPIFSKGDFESIHYNQNISSTYTVATGSNFIDYFTYDYEGHVLLSVLSQEFIQFYIVNSSISLTLYQEYNLSLSSFPNVLKSFKFNDTQFIFICFSNQCLVYTVDLLSPFDFFYKETITTGWDIIDINFFNIEGVFSILLFNNIGDLNAYSYSTLFNYISTFNFITTAEYTQYANSHAFNKVLDGSYYTQILLNSNPIINGNYAVVLDVTDLSNIFIATEGPNYFTAPAAVGYKSTSSITYKNLNFFGDYFSTSQFGIKNVLNLYSEESLPDFGFTFLSIINTSEYNGTPCMSFFNTNNKPYVLCNRSNPGDPTEYLSCYEGTDVSNYRYATSNIFYYTVQLADKCVDLLTINVGLKVISVSLLGNNTVYLYDVSDPEFAGQNQQLTKDIQKFENDNFLSLAYLDSANFIHKINSNGSSDWATYIGGTVNSLENTGFDIDIQQIILDQSQQNLYLSGFFNTRVQTYNYTSTGYILSQQITNNNYNLYTDAFTQKLNTLNGYSIYVIPQLGVQTTKNNSIGYIQSDNSIVVAGFTESNISTLYSPQSAGSIVNPSNIQKNIVISSLGSGFINKFNSAGTLQWSNLIYTEDPSRNISLRKLINDNTKITVLGTSNTTTMKCLDSNNNVSQILYSNINYSTDFNLFFYCFNTSGNYLQSNLLTFDAGSLADIFRFNVSQNKTANEIVITSTTRYSSLPADYKQYNKDGTLANIVSYNASNIRKSNIVKYKYDSTFYDDNGLSYSQIVFNQNTPYTFTGGYFENYYIYIGDSIGSTGINKSFSIRDNFTGSNGNPCVILNTYIQIPSLNRYFTNINGIPNSENYYIISIGKSPLESIVEYDLLNVNTGTNQITVLKSLSVIDPNQFYYLTYPCDGDNIIIPVTNIQSLGDGVYIFTLENIKDLECPTGSSYYGPYLYLSSFNESLYYNLQFFPGSIAQPVYYNVKLQSMTIPNRPLLNLSNVYGGTRTINDLPFIYLSIYNEDDNGNYDTQIINVVYDSTPLNNVKPYPIFQIPVSNQSSANNFATFSSDIQPVVKFSPGYYNLRIRLFDMKGNPIQFDTSATKPSDYTFVGGIVPPYLTNIYFRLAFTKR